MADRQCCPIPMLCGVEFCDCPADDRANAVALLALMPSLDGKAPPPAPTPPAGEESGCRPALALSVRAFEGLMRAAGVPVEWDADTTLEEKASIAGRAILSVAPQDETDG
jgi:hypothetical protein